MLNNYKIDHDNIELPSTLLASAGDTTSTTVFGKQTAFGAPREESSKEESSCLRALTMQAELARLRSFVQGGGRGGRGGRRGGSSRGDVAQLGPEPTLLLRLLHPDHSTQKPKTPVIIPAISWNAYICKRCLYNSIRTSCINFLVSAKCRAKIRCVALVGRSTYTSILLKRTHLQPEKDLEHKLFSFYHVSSENTLCFACWQEFIPGPATCTYDFTNLSF